MQARLFGRLARVIVSFPSKIAGDYSGLAGQDMIFNATSDPDKPGMRIAFKITSTDQKAPNTSTIVVTNLNDDSRAKLQLKGLKVELQAGYVGTGASRIFLGDTRIVDSVRSGADWDATFRLGDGERSYRFARVAESFAGGTPYSAVMQRLASLGGIPLGNVPSQASQLRGQYGHGYVAQGRWSDCFDKFIKSIGLTWSIQSGAIQVLAPGESVPVSIPLISPETGLVDSPEMGTPEKQGQPALLKFKSLLFPARPGTQVHVRSNRYDGVVRIRKCELEGDTHGNPWYTTCEGVIAPNTAAV